MKRIFKLLVSLSMIFTLLPAMSITTHAAEANAIYVTDTVGGSTVGVSTTSDQSGTGWSYDATSKQLTLDGFNGENITADGDINIVLKGTNTITMDDSDSSNYGIKSDGSITITAATSTETDKLIIQKTDINGNYKYFYGIRAYNNLTINSGSISCNFAEDSANTGKCYIYGGIGNTNASTYIKNDATYTFSADMPHGLANGTSRDLKVETSGDITITINSISDIDHLSSYACDGLEIAASASGNITLSNPNGKALDGPLTIKAGATTSIHFKGMVSLSTSYLYYGYYLAPGYQFTTPSEECGFITQAVQYSSSYSRNEAVLSTSEGTFVSEAVLEKTSDTSLQVMDSDLLDITGLKIETSYSSNYLNGIIYGGTYPLTVSATGLPDGLQLSRTTFNANNTNYLYIYGTPTTACDEGDFTLTFTDANSNSKSITIHYDGVAENPKYISIGDTKLNVNDTGNGSGWTYDGSTKTLTLDNYNGEKIISEKDLNIVLKGTNTITMDDSDSSNYGIKSDGSITITAATSTENDKLIVQKTDINSSSKYFYGVRAYNNLTINSGSISCNFAEADENTGYNYIYGGIGNTNGKTYIKNDATYTFNADMPHGRANGTSRGLNVQTSGDITINVNNANDSDRLYSYACDGLELTASASGNITLSNPDGKALDGLLKINEGCTANIHFKGMVSLSTSYLYSGYYLASGYKFTTPSEECGFITQSIQYSSSYSRNEAVLSTSDGTMISEATLEKTSDTSLKVMDSDLFDITGLEINKSYRSNYLNGIVNGGTYPLTVSATGLPDGLQLSRTTFNANNTNYLYIYGTPTTACDEGDITLTFTDANNNSKSITIHYDAIFSGEPITSVTLDQNEVTVVAKEKTTLTATILPSTVVNTNLSWSVSDDSIAYVVSKSDGTATIQTKKAGTVTVTAKAWAGFKDSCTIHVLEATPATYVKVTGENSGEITGFDSSKNYKVTIDGVDYTVSNSTSFTLTNEMLGKEVSIICLNDDTICNSKVQTYTIPTALVQTSIKTLEDKVSFDCDTFTYDGTRKTPTVTIEGLTKEVDYSYYFSNNTDAGTATVYMYGIGQYKGSMTKTFTINPASLDSASVNDIQDRTYNGNEQKPAVSIKANDTTLVKDTDYTIEYTNNVKVGEATITITGINNYTGTKVVHFNIVGVDISNYTANLEYRETPYNKTAQKPTVTIEGLVENEDYTVTYPEDCTSVGTKTITITGIGTCQGSYTREYEITKGVLGEATLWDGSYIYDGTSKKPTVEIEGLTENKDFTVTYPEDTINVGEKTVIITGINNYGGTKEEIYSIEQANISKVTFSATSYTYNGKAHYPTVSVYAGAKKLVKGTDYTTNTYTSNKKPGTYTITVTGKGNYTGTLKKTYKINVKATTLKTLTKGTKSFTAKWTKQTNTYISGYQIQYSTSSKFTSAKTVTVSSYKTTSKTIKSLKAKKKYYVRVRTFKTISGKKYYSAWSKSKTVTTK